MKSGFIKFQYFLNDGFPKMMVIMEMMMVLMNDDDGGGDGGRGGGGLGAGCCGGDGCGGSGEDDDCGDNSGMRGQCVQLKCLCTTRPCVAQPGMHGRDDHTDHHIDHRDGDIGVRII